MLSRAAHVWPVCGCSINIETFIWEKRTEQSNQDDRLSLESVLSPWRQQHERGCYSDSRTIHPTPSINTLISQKSPFSRRLISSHCSRETYRRSFIPTVIRLSPHLSKVNTFPLILLFYKIHRSSERYINDCTTAVWCNTTFGLLDQSFTTVQYYWLFIWKYFTQ